jgi:outer membrane protein
MNNKILITLNALLVIAVAVLFYLQFKSPSTVASSDAVTNDSLVSSLPSFDSTLTVIKDGNGAIAYIDYEVLTSKYQFYKDGVKKLEDDMKRKESELMAKQRELEENFERYKSLASSMSPEVREKRERDLMEEEKRLFDLRDRLAGDLTTREAEFNKQFLTKIDTYLKTLAKEKNYNYIFIYSKGGPATIVYANDSLNISSQVVNSMNKEYKK